VNANTGGAGNAVRIILADPQRSSHWAKKCQGPNPKQISNTKEGNSKRKVIARFEFAPCRFGFVWDLGFGPWNFTHTQ
jgi:hypothetical protein